MNVSRSSSYLKRWACSLRKYINPGKTTGDIVIVGGGRATSNRAKLIERAAIVVRFNDCKSSCWNNGYRTDILLINNTGPAALKYCKANSLATPFPFKSPWQYIFVRDIGSHKEHYKKMASFFPEYGADIFEDYSAEIVHANRIQPHMLSWIPHGFSQDLFHQLEQISSGPFLCPSTGMIGIAWMLMNEQFLDRRIHLIGFSFAGWEAHPWPAERELVLQQVRLGRCVLHPP